MSLADDPIFKDLAAKVSMQAELNIGMALELERNTKATNEINCKVDTIVKDTKDVIEAFKGAKASFELLESVSKIAKILIPILIVMGWLGYAGTSTWAATKKFLGIA